MNTDEVRVHHVVGANRGEPCYLLYTSPDIRLHEEGTRWLAVLAQRASETHQRNVAYALSHWLNFCLGAGVDPVHATLDDVLAYKNAMAGTISALTGEPFAAGTIAQRVSAIASYYDHGVKARWNRTALDMGNELRAVRERTALVAVVGRTQASPINKSAARYAPRSERGETDIRPLDVEPLKRLLDALGPSEDNAQRNNQPPKRDRLIAEWLCYVGLRIEEVLGSGKKYRHSGRLKKGLTSHQILCLTPDNLRPFDHQQIGVVGKFAKARQVAVPNWLVLRTQEYIRAERSHATKEIKHPSALLFVCGKSAGAAHRGRPLSIRRYQKIFESACLKAGLVRLVEKSVKASNQTRLFKVAQHSPHDLRHTYAVMSYFAEVALGNAEPWKPIQAQLGHRHLQTTIDTYLAFVSVHSRWRDLRRMSVRELVGLRCD